jgi:hypothetical protein
MTTLKTLLASAIFVAFTILSANAQSFNFVAVEETTKNLGSKWDQNFAALNSEMTISFDGKSLKMHFSSGESYWGKLEQIEILEVIEVKRTVISGKVKELELSLKFIEDGYTEYAVYTFSESYFRKTHSISIPYRIYGMVFSYVTYYGYENL